MQDIKCFRYIHKCIIPNNESVDTVLLTTVVCAVLVVAGNSVVVGGSVVSGDSVVIGTTGGNRAIIKVLG